MAADLGSMPGHFCRKMSRSNTCRKLRKCAENKMGGDDIDSSPPENFYLICTFLTRWPWRTI